MMSIPFLFYFSTFAQRNKVAHSFFRFYSQLLFTFWENPSQIHAQAAVLCYTKVNYCFCPVRAPAPLPSIAGPVVGKARTEGVRPHGSETFPLPAGSCGGAGRPAAGGLHPAGGAPALLIFSVLAAGGVRLLRGRDGQRHVPARAVCHCRQRGQL